MVIRLLWDPEDRGPSRAGHLRFKVGGAVVGGGVVGVDGYRTYDYPTIQREEREERGTHTVVL